MENIDPNIENNSIVSKSENSILQHLTLNNMEDVLEEYMENSEEEIEHVLEECKANTTKARYENG